MADEDDEYRAFSPTMTRKAWVEAMIDRGNIPELLRHAAGYACYCKGCFDGEPECFCAMNSNQIRRSVSLAGLRRGRLVRLRQ